jgi:CheY-specific phosphatase CheX
MKKTEGNVSVTAFKDGMPDNIADMADLFFMNISESVEFIFKMLLKIDVTHRKKYSRRLNSLPKDIIITISYNADLEGYFSYFISLKTALEICSRLDSEVDREFFGKDHLDIIGEFGNMISGNTVGKLKTVDSDVRISTPHLSGFHEILASEKSHWFYSCNFNMDLGHFGVLLAIKK